MGKGKAVENIKPNETNKKLNNEGKDGKPSSSSSSSYIKSILAKPELTPEDTKVLLDYIDKHHIDPKAADSELTKDINLDNVKINNASKVAENLKEAYEKLLRSQSKKLLRMRKKLKKL